MRKKIKILEKRISKDICKDERVGNNDEDEIGGSEE